ncbi:hypothetical protein ABPG72_000753 [Tetrahymena utriculariae]
MHCQKQRFEIEHKKPHEQNEGDIQILYQTIFGQINQTFQKTIEEINNTSALNKSISILSQHIPFKQYANDEQQKSFSSQSKCSRSYLGQSKVVSLKDLNFQCSPCQEEQKVKTQFYSQEKEGNSIFQQNKQICLDSKILIQQSECKKPYSQNELESQEIQKWNQILIQDEFIFEKILKKLGKNQITIEYLKLIRNLLKIPYKQFKAKKNQDGLLSRFYYRTLFQ